ncbi:FMN reductase [Microbacterium sp. F51-2R]|uniref:FMN reductase n=1 Tax=Microbacterium sp. F51-2R TaxID=3445777 RepID=UPI003FA0D491
MTTARRIAVVSAGLSNPSSTRMLADRLAASTVAALGQTTGADGQPIPVEVDVFELRDYAHDITNNLLTGFAPPALESMINAVVSADALIAVTPIFSTSYSGLFKSFIDVLEPDALTGKPVLIGANAGTARHSLAIDYAIRPLFTYLHAEPVSTGVFAASSDWGGSGDQVAPLGERIERGARELAEAVARRAPEASVDPFDPSNYLGEGRSFGHLLGGLAGE